MFAYRESFDRHIRHCAGICDQSDLDALLRIAAVAVAVSADRRDLIVGAWTTGCSCSGVTGFQRAAGGSDEDGLNLAKIAKYASLGVSNIW